LSATGPGPGAPNRGRFRKGQSGNPGGRPRKQETANASAFDIVVGKTLSVTRNGIPREVTMEEALQHRTYQDAIAGKRMAQRQVLKWIETREAWLEKHAPKVYNTKVRFETTTDPDNIDEALLLLGIADHNPGRAGLDKDRAQLLLEPWAVQAALTRRRNAAPLPEKEISEIRRCTRDPEQVRWPRESLP
jgi:hypothetical protein